MNVYIRVTVSTQIWRHSEKHENDARLDKTFFWSSHASVRPLCAQKSPNASFRQKIA